MKKAQEQTILLYDFELSMPTATDITPIFSRATNSEYTPLHRHSYIEFFYVYEGSGIHILNGKEQILTRGDAYIMPPNDVHGFPQKDGTIFRHMDIGIKIDYFKKLCDFLSPGLFNDFLNGDSIYFKLSSEQISKFEHYIPYLYLDQTDRTYALSAKALATTLMLLLIESHYIKRPDVPSWLLELLTVLNSRNNFKLELSDLISDFPYNADYMRRLFKKHTGMTMTDYFNRQKMDHAYTLLSTTDASVETICEMVGIDSLSYFYNLFKRVFNTTPGEIQKQEIKAPQ